MEDKYTDEELQDLVDLGATISKDWERVLSVSKLKNWLQDIERNWIIRDVLEIPYEDLPCYINDLEKNHENTVWKNMIVSWRLKIGK